MKKNNVFSLLVILLLLVNCYFLTKILYKKPIEETSTCLITKEKKLSKSYNKNEKYYNAIKYKDLNKLLKNDDLSSIAILDGNSNTSEKFTEYINKIAFYRKENINLLNISKLSSKDLVSFYEIDERLSTLQSNYIIVIKSGKIVMLIDIDNSELNNILKMYK